jgi:hypothetical protein
VDDDYYLRELFVEGKPQHNTCPIANKKEKAVIVEGVILTRIASVFPLQSRVSLQMDTRVCPLMVIITRSQLS